MRCDERFDFGKNWQQFLKVVDESRIQVAVDSLQAVLEVTDLRGKSFVDIGCGSGLFSLAARRLGASVRSFDHDARSVACTTELKFRYRADDAGWTIDHASVLDANYLDTLGTFDVVYSWGVLHHTGAMWDAIENACRLVASDGQLCISIYNDQGFWSRGWRLVKRTYQRLPIVLRPALVAALGATMFTHRATTTLLAMLLRLLTLRNPLVPAINWLRQSGPVKQRGMHGWYDLVDWVGGYPFEVAKPETVFNFCRRRGFTLTHLSTQGSGHGCNEFVFEHISTARVRA
ncbi:MAG TPA: methyltransferase domain-containing protein [Pirellulales bacterium]|nr:methyltransferase domain-containing protein [Pirellulales bacterium]